MNNANGRKPFRFAAGGQRVTAGVMQAPMGADDRINRAIAERLRHKREQQPGVVDAHPEAPSPFVTGRPAYAAEG